MNKDLRWQQRFEYTFEPNDGEVWLDMLESQNKLAHTYKETTFNGSVTAVRASYYPQVRDLVAVLQDKA